MKKAAFLDRDGVINRRPPAGEYVTCWEKLEFLPGVAGAIARLDGAGFQVIIISNQRCVAKGLLTMGELDSIHQRMCKDLAAAGAIVAGGYYCPHDLEPPCACRKPAPGMLLTAARDHDIDLAASWMIGDSEIDVQAGSSAGCRTVRILESHEPRHSVADYFADSLPSAVQHILAVNR